MRLLLLLALALTSCQSRVVPEAKPLPVVRVDVWHDTVCPWCRIGLHNLEAAVKAQPGVKVEVVHHPFLLQPDAPLQGVDLREHLAQKYGLTDVNQMFSRVSQVGAQYGVTFRWDLVRRMPNTAASHALLTWAPAEAKGRVLEGLHRAYFDEGRDIGDVEVLVVIATSAGLEAVAARKVMTDSQALLAVQRSAQEASQQGVNGVPYFLVGGVALNGAQSPERLGQAIAQAAGVH